MNTGTLEDDRKNNDPAPIYTTASTHHPNRALNGHAQNQALTGYDTPQYESVTQQRHQLNSSLVYSEVGPTMTQEAREPQDYALPVTSSGHFSIESQPYEVPVRSLPSHSNAKVVCILVTT